MSAVRDSTNGYVREGETSLDEVIDYGEDDLSAECREFCGALQEAFAKAKLTPLEEDIIRYRFYYQGNSTSRNASPTICAQGMTSTNAALGTCA